MNRFLAYLFLICPVLLQAVPQVYTDNPEKLALEGYDAVSYFKEKKPQLGQPKYQLEWSGAKWRFSSKENYDMFKSHPQAFAPQYGGYCPHAIAAGHYVGGLPQVWAIDQGKLYLLCSYEGLQTWSEDGNHIKALADQRWKENAAPYSRERNSGHPVSQANPSWRN